MGIKYTFTFLYDRFAKVIKQPDYAFYRICNGFSGLGSFLIVENKGDNKSIINQKEIRVVGLRRTGNHAIINWIEKQQKGKCIHLNNIEVNENPYKSIYLAKLGKGHPKDRWKARRIGRYNDYSGTEAEIRLLEESKGNFMKKDCLIINYEDYPLSKISNNHSKKFHDKYLGRSAMQIDVIILRDPFNLFASRMKKGFWLTRSSSANMAKLWIDYAKEFLGETNYMDNNKVTVNFNRWVRDPDYRRELADRLGLEFSDEGFNEVSLCGGGSSFDQTKYHGNTSSMNVLSRWHQYVDHPDFRKLFRNPEIIEYSSRIFGEIEGTELFY